jgi:phosphoglycolate phosphatase
MPPTAAVRRAALLFDLDGTLTDPRAGIVASIRHALGRLDRPSPDDDTLATFIGPPLRGTFAGLLATDDPALIERAIVFYRERFADTGLFENHVYPGIPAMLEAVAPGRKFVATVKPTVFAERIVRHFGLAHHFAGVYGAELDDRLDDKADLLAHLLRRERLAAAGTVMIGDRAGDVRAARANGVASVGVLWGYGSERELAEAGADRLCASPAGLVACLADLAR